jgi:hypothetical protein
MIAGMKDIEALDLQVLDRHMRGACHHKGRGAPEFETQSGSERFSRRS